MPESLAGKKPVGSCSCGPSDISRCWTSFLQKCTCSFNEGLRRTMFPDTHEEEFACIIILLCLPVSSKRVFEDTSWAVSKCPRTAPLKDSCHLLHLTAAVWATDNSLHIVLSVFFLPHPNPDLHLKTPRVVGQESWLNNQSGLGLNLGFVA